MPTTDILPRKYFVSFSGGLGSGISALIAHEQGLDFELVFADTLIEDEDLYRFNQDIAKAVGKEIVHLVDGRNPWEVFVDRKWIGNSRTAHCSTELKTKQVKKYIAENAKEGDVLVLGMDWSELDRIERARAHWKVPIVSLLNDYNVSRDMFDDMLAKYNIAIPRLYEKGFLHNNCGGFCVKTGQKQMKMLMEHFPDRYAWHEEQMVIATDRIGPTARPFIRVIKKKVMNYLSLKEFREYLDRGNVIEADSPAGCGCFTDED